MAGPEVFDSPYFRSRDLRGRIVTVLQGVSEQRGLRLEAYRSRALPRHSIHELMVTDESAGPGDTVMRVALTCFFEVEQPGVLLIGSEVYSGDIRLGVVAGFDDTHMPNHQNICLRSDALVDGKSAGIEVEGGLYFRFTGPDG